MGRGGWEGKLLLGCLGDRRLALDLGEGQLDGVDQEGGAGARRKWREEAVGSPGQEGEMERERQGQRQTVRP